MPRRAVERAARPGFSHMSPRTLRHVELRPRRQARPGRALPSHEARRARRPPPCSPAASKAAARTVPAAHRRHAHAPLPRRRGWRAASRGSCDGERVATSTSSVSAGAWLGSPARLRRDAADARATARRASPIGENDRRSEAARRMGSSAAQSSAMEAWRSLGSAARGPDEDGVEALDELGPRRELLRERARREARGSAAGRSAGA